MCPSSRLGHNFFLKLCPPRARYRNSGKVRKKCKGSPLPEEGLGLGSVPENLVDCSIFAILLFILATPDSSPSVSAGRCKKKKKKKKKVREAAGVEPGLYLFIIFFYFLAFALTCAAERQTKTLPSESSPPGRAGGRRL